MAVQETIHTVDDLWELSQGEGSGRFELDEGALVELSPTSDTHGLLTNWIAYLITAFVVAGKLGKVFAAETGFILTPNVVRAPDVAFVSNERYVPRTGKFYPIAPDLAVEVVSPTDKAVQIRRKVDQFLMAGTRLVWVVYPDERFIDIFQPQKPSITLKIDGVLDGSDVLPEFSLAVSRVFEALES